MKINHEDIWFADFEGDNDSGKNEPAKVQKDRVKEMNRRGENSF
jgi:hypothetical protein